MNPSTQIKIFEASRSLTRAEIEARKARIEAAKKWAKPQTYGSQEKYLSIKEQIYKGKKPKILIGDQSLECDLLEEEVKSHNPQTIQERNNLAFSIQEKKEELSLSYPDNYKKSKCILMAFILSQQPFQKPTNDRVNDQ